MRPRWGQVREFCAKQGYKETRTDHFHYVKVLPDRSTSGTMVSMGVDGEEVPPQFWSRVWRQQLRLASEEEFWKGLRGEPAAYAIPPAAPAEQSLPAYLRRFLQGVLHLSEQEIAQLDREQAQALLNQHYARDLREP